MLQPFYKTLARLALILPLLALAACGGESAPAEAPQAFTVVAGDGRATLTWNQDPNMTYWLFAAQADSVTPDNYNKFPESVLLRGVSSPFTLPNLTNGKTYSFTINATRNGSPAGPAAPSQAIVPRPAGTSWTPGAPLGSADLNKIGADSSRYVVIGNAGSIYTLTTGFTSTGKVEFWVKQNAKTTADLRAHFFEGTYHMVMGSSGTLIYSADASNWKTIVTGPAAAAEQFNALGKGGNIFLAVGQGGAIYTGSADILTVAELVPEVGKPAPPAPKHWDKQVSNTTANLNALIYNPQWKRENSVDMPRYVVVGDGGTILVGEVIATDTNGTLSYHTVWTQKASGTNANLYDVIYNSTLGSYFVVGSGGTLLMSTDTETWTKVALPTTQSLHAVTMGSIGSIGGRILAVGANGTTVMGDYTSSKGTDGKTVWSYAWSVGSAGAISNHNDVIAGDGSYLAVGASGTNTRSF